MTDKVQKIRKEVERIQLYTQSEVLKQVLDYIEKVQEEPVSKEIGDYDHKAVMESLHPELKEEPVSEDLNTESMFESYKQRLISQANGMKNSPLIDMCLASYKHGINETLDTLKLSNVERTVKNWKEPACEDLEQEITKYCDTIYRNWTEDARKKDSLVEELCKQTARHFAKWGEERVNRRILDKMNQIKDKQICSDYDIEIEDFISEDLEKASIKYAQDKYMAVQTLQAFKAGAKWKKENLWKPADGDGLPEIDREVIALLNNGKVVFAHRPPEYWDGKDIVTGKVTRNYPKTYDKGGWNIPNIVYWLDVELPKEIEL